MHHLTQPDGQSMGREKESPVSIPTSKGRILHGHPEGRHPLKILWLAYSITELETPEPTVELFDQIDDTPQFCHTVDTGTVDVNPR